VWRSYGNGEHRQALQRLSEALDCIAAARQGEAEHRIPTQRNGIVWCSKGKEEPGPAKEQHGKPRLSRGKAQPSMATVKQADGEQS